MTHLLNKATAEHAISHILLSTPEELHALFAIDIDNFKAVNDIFGHKMGDHTISVVAGILASHFSGSDIIGRIGGDEFVAFMRDIASRQAVYEKAQELLDAILDKEALSIPENVTISIGIAFTEPYETSYTTLFQKADTALGNSKKSGKTMFFRVWCFCTETRHCHEKYFIIYTFQKCCFHFKICIFLPGQTHKSIFRYGNTLCHYG